ncbi:terminase large subunit domain-containing protein [Heyndrickxia sporothermodurans]|uniref:terminase large subunit domain-containing protein n=1 Tax=Heyndrickxia sporothermodurans TaxID=46224 RepID=UPI001056E50D|nr:terminase family protein [Heyndrickxia sporothermodurans]
MCIDSLHRTFTNPKYRVLFVTPYENQVRLIFMRLRELIDSSPVLKAEVAKNTSNPFQIVWKNGSAILGFTTGASSGSGGASIRGQKADYIYMDEVDYMADSDFDTVTTIAAERGDIGIFMSSTPTGKRSKFYEACMNKSMGYTEHYHPSTHNPNWDERMEAEFRAQLSDQGYVHEILADFGTQDTGVFDKDKLDAACNQEFYHYEKLSPIQLDKVEKLGVRPNLYVYDKGQRAPMNPFRTMGVDWDKYGASSSILILDFDVIRQKFKVIKRIEVPRAEYSYDAAVNMIVELNDQYNPSWIYCDRGSGEYQIERLQLIGEKRPSTGLKNKVKGWQFKNVVEVMNPVTKEIDRKPLKPFMVNQLQIAFERERMILSPFDETLHKQLVDYEVVRQGASGPVFTSENEHFVDALGLAYLAFVLEFSDLTDTIKKPEFSTKFAHTKARIGEGRAQMVLKEIEMPQTSEVKKVLNHDPNELRGDRPTWVKVNEGYRSRSGMGRSSWGSRSGGLSRSSW